MSQKLPNMIDTTMQKLRELVDVNTVVGQPVTIPGGVTIIPVSRISVGFGGGGSDFVTSKSGAENPFGGGMGGGVCVTPVCFLVIQDGNVRMISVPTPINSTADRIVDMVPDTFERLVDFLDERKKNKE